MKVHQPVQALDSHRNIPPRRQAMSLTVLDLLSTTAGRRIQTHRTSSRRTVFVYQAPRQQDEDHFEASEVAKRAELSQRLARFRNREPFSPVGSTVLRPVADAANTLTILREILRGFR